MKFLHSYPSLDTTMHTKSLLLQYISCSVLEARLDGIRYLMTDITILFTHENLLAVEFTTYIMLLIVRY
jgi:hypothetical protein